MKPIFRRLFASVIGGAGGAAVTEIFQVSRDTDLFPDLPTRNYGVTTVLQSNSGKKSLFYFDLSTIATGRSCTSATLRLYHAVTGGATAFTLTAYAVAVGNAGWVEGTKDNAQAGAGEPCWDAKAANGSGEVTTAWAGSAGMSTSGTDYEATALGTVAGNRSDAVGVEYVINLTPARIAEMFGAGTNYGILLISTTSTLGLASRHHATVAYRPTLTVVHTNP